MICGQETGLKIERRLETKMNSNLKKNNSPKVMKQNFTIDPCRGFAALASTMVAPEGYRFQRMDRKGTKGTITWVRE